MGRTVLIVEDHEFNMMLLDDLLRANGYDTLQAADGAAAMALAREHRPDLIVLDIQLPRVSGLDFLRWLKRDAHLRDVPVIAVTAFAMPGDEHVMRAAGCADYIAKPISTRHFLDVVRRHAAPVGDGQAP